MPFLDARRIPDGATLETDVCIVGAGAAGCTLARELAGQDFKVFLIESGGIRYDGRIQALAKGELASDFGFPLDDTRVRGFGGTTAIWMGACRPLDAYDFEPHDWVPYSGWPFGRSELDPYYARAQVVCQIGPPTYELQDWEEPDAQELPLDPQCIDTQLFQISPPTRFARAYREAIFSAPNITTLLHANVLEIDTTDNTRVATSVRIATFNRTRFRVGARLFVLAVGGVEAPRLLLASNRRNPAGLGQEHDLVGRFFMDHPRLESAVLHLNDAPTRMRLYRVHASHRVAPPTAIEGFLSIASEALARERMVRCAFQVPPHWRSYPEFHSNGVMALRQIAWAIRAGHVPYRWPHRVRTALAGARAVALTALRRLGEGHMSRADFVLTACGEQAPNPASRVVLAETRDYFGAPQPRLDWQLSEIDLRSIRRANEILASAVKAAGIGCVTSLIDSNGKSRNLRGGFHHMGTTRMHRDPRQGVVDPDCRVHGMANLFIAGSATFPTGGYANPTLTIVALALRLADHIRDQLRNGPPPVNVC
ncbi:MAG: GMC family oxidoreductase [Chloroflexi bacterium]|nr:GMC family oxidoreductase [Chloroflexota bacterium]